MNKPKFVYYDDDRVSHIDYDICSIAIHRTDEGIVVDIWEPNFEGGEPVASTWAHENELTHEH